MRVEPSQKFLLKYLVDNELLLDCAVKNEDNLHISAATTYQMIAKEQPGWEVNVDGDIAALIKQRKFFKATAP